MGGGSSWSIPPLDDPLWETAKIKKMPCVLGFQDQSGICTPPSPILSELTQSVRSIIDHVILIWCIRWTAVLHLNLLRFLIVHSFYNGFVDDWVVGFRDGMNARMKRTRQHGTWQAQNVLALLRVVPGSIRLAKVCRARGSMPVGLVRTIPCDKLISPFQFQFHQIHRKFATICQSLHACVLTPLPNHRANALNPQIDQCWINVSPGDRTPLQIHLVCRAKTVDLMIAQSTMAPLPQVLEA